MFEKMSKGYVSCQKNYILDILERFLILKLPKIMYLATKKPFKKKILTYLFDFIFYRILLFFLYNKL